MSKADLIDRRTAIDALIEHFKRNTTVAIRAKLTVEGVPSAQPERDTGYSDGFTDGYKAGQKDIQPEPQWIPCSERLPKPFEYCLWTTTDGRVVYHHCDGMFSNYTAWMPLPEPWRGANL